MTSAREFPAFRNNRPSQASKGAVLPSWQIAQIQSELVIQNQKEGKR
jgi:hypothetical protein